MLTFFTRFALMLSVCLLLAACGKPMPQTQPDSFYVFDRELRIVCMTSRTTYSYWVATCYQLATDDDLSVWEDRYLADR